MFPFNTNPVTADIALKKTKALPAAGAANASDAFDFGQATLHPLNRKLALQVDLPATPALVDAKTITLTVKDSADGVTFAAIPELAPLVVTGAGGAGAAAVSRTFPLPGTTRKYVRTDAEVLAAGGDNTGVSVTSQVLVQL